ncbi:GGDEF domain-containing protein [Thalassospira sp. MA62]|nr:GGDEF domain-containing protein [Thalassospira sp. MA62]
MSFITRQQMNQSQIKFLMELAEDFQQQTAINNRATEETHQGDTLSTLVDLARSMQSRLNEQQLRIRQLESMVETDELTGLYNRRGFLRRIREALSRSNRHDETGILVIADLDNFKEINDRSGHTAGDAVLRHFGQNLRTHIRADDFVARFGGDEFAILMHGSSADAAQKRIAQLRDATARFPLIWQGTPLRIEASFGFAVYDAKSDPATLLRLADEEMYKSKRGRSEPTAANKAKTNTNVA